MLKRYWLIGAGLAAVGVPQLALAHEVYVLTPRQYQIAAGMPVVNLFDAFSNPNNGYLVLLIIGITLFGIICSFLFWNSQLGRFVDHKLRQLSFVGPLFVRLAIALTLFFSALNNHFLGPELSLSTWAFGSMVRFLLFGLALTIALGFVLDFSLLIVLALYLYSFTIYGYYILTYVVLFGAALALLLVDRKLLTVGWFMNKSQVNDYLKNYGPFVTRLFLGLSFVYTAISVKLLHPAISLAVISQYHLDRSFILPHDPLLIVLGAAIVETLVGLCLIIGFQVRLVSLVMLFFMTLSVFFFREALWPHVILFALLAALLVSGGGRLSLDRQLRLDSGLEDS